MVLWFYFLRVLCPTNYERISHFHIKRWILIQQISNSNAGTQLLGNFNVQQGLRIMDLLTGNITIDLSHFVACLWECCSSSVSPKMDLYLNARPSPGVLFSIHHPVQAWDQTIFSLTFQQSTVMKDLLYMTCGMIVSLPVSPFVFLFSSVCLQHILYGSEYK